MPLISAEFFSLFLLTLALYYLFPERQRWLVLLLASLIFYLFSGIYSFVIILIFTLSSYFFALLVEGRNGQESEFVARGGEKGNKKDRKKKSYLITLFSVVCIVSFWIFARSRPVAALGISFYSLRIISYLVDVHRGRMRAQRNILKYALFASFFPLAYLGPVARYKEIGESLYAGSKADAEAIASGLLRTSWGIFKKVVVANALSLPLANIAASPDRYFGAYTLFLLIFYSAEIYCDFSGGIDICIGVAQTFGVRLPENFESPFASRNLREFWNRWHITLGEWFEHYVFYPISLSRPMQRLSRFCRRRFGTHIGKRLPLYAATMLTWALTGLWHGAEGHFIAWGLINGALVLVSQEVSRPIEKLYDKYPRLQKSRSRAVIGRVRVFLIIGAVRLLDVYRSLPLTACMLSTVFGGVGSYGELLSGGIFELMTPASLAVVLVSLALVFFVSAGRRTSESIANKPFAAVFCIIGLTLGTLVFGTYGIGFDASDFIYSHFNGG